ncbi:hypothetical protein EMIHUDRAFT_197508 [Emiliania huxleyi CCMP1516]|uniref:Uncharacterized protein n=2 Tax=Emiliania huxleyi TaxID=2903 RepID=A0A0D3IUF2_EMIH1|nr:hypothetical protein EMIHUDRAFT_197508 [Emiliania huxleyi CCMP1516]EOD14887.1 hypothetical protein EMIHUDRAFT_197508 [Emiliania huxleyi CCMP1516]|eukprot:XP_005767316.1 hypothetical protein EMIHUDRAFT_197508 [Emiliania huxleyi CCMP1516]
MDYATVARARASFDAAFRRDVSASLGVAQESVMVVAVAAGSTIVAFCVEGEPDAAGRLKGAGLLTDGLTDFNHGVAVELHAHLFGAEAAMIGARVGAHQPPPAEEAYRREAEAEESEDIAAVAQAAAERRSSWRRSYFGEEEEGANEPASTRSSESESGAAGDGAALDRLLAQAFDDDEGLSSPDARAESAAAQRACALRAGWAALTREAGRLAALGAQHEARRAGRGLLIAWLVWRRDARLARRERVRTGESVL